MPAIDASLRKFHASLNVSNLERSVAFYRVLLGTEPAKVRSDYAKFDLADPPLVLSLIPGQPQAGGHLNHVGLRVRTAEELVDVQRRLEGAGMPTQREDGVECCYARQTKFWISDPDGALWEIYVFHEDIAEHGHGAPPRAEAMPAPMPRPPYPPSRARGNIDSASRCRRRSRTTTTRWTRSGWKDQSTSRAIRRIATVSCGRAFARFDRVHRYTFMAWLATARAEPVSR